MGALSSIRKRIEVPQQFKVGRDLSGGVRIELGGRGFVCSPDEAVNIASAILRSAGVNVEFRNPGQGVVPQ